MGKDPAILFYTSDFLTGTMLLTDDQVGKYIKLLCLQHQKGVLTEKDMLKVCETHDTDIFEKFEIDDMGNYFNIRLKEEADKRRAYSESRKKNRQKKDMNKICKTYVLDMENENVNENTNTDIIAIKDEINIAFDDFWKKYPLKQGKNECRDIWDSKKKMKNGKYLTNELRTLIMLRLPIHLAYKEASGEKLKHPKTLINSEFWEDEYEQIPLKAIRNKEFQTEVKKETNIKLIDNYEYIENR